MCELEHHPNAAYGYAHRNGDGEDLSDGAHATDARIRWDNPDRAPLLLIGGELDLIADASMTRAIHRKQALAPSRTDLKIFEGRSHWTCMDAGWETVADYALDWARSNARPART